MKDKWKKGKRKTGEYYIKNCRPTRRKVISRRKKEGAGKMIEMHNI